jgi:glycosyltransferase involved in cell wall biosynthesis
MKQDWSTVEMRLAELARSALANPHEFTQYHLRWAKLFAPVIQSCDMQIELLLLESSFPALFPEGEWYRYFAHRCGLLLESESLHNLSDDSIARLQKLQRRCDAFAGTFRASPKQARANSYIGTRDQLTIGIDIRSLSVPSSRNRGIGRYLISTLNELVRINRKHKFVLLGDYAAVSDEQLREMFSSKSVTFRELKRGCDNDLDIFLLTDPCPMLTGRRTASLPIKRCPWMAIVYDFIPLEFPDLYLRGNLAMLDEYLSNVETLAAQSIAVFPISEYVGHQCEHLLGMPADHIIPIMGGVDPTLFANDRPLNTADQDEVPYFLYVGGADARKNIPGLIKAFDVARPRLPQGTALVLVGEMNAERVSIMLLQLGCEHLKECVIGRGGISDEELNQLYINAFATVFVSLSEGLGLPALEAMACGCPVIASNGSALAETVGRAGMLVDPLSTQDISNALEAIANNETLRAELIASGRARAKQWRWNDVATKLLQGIERHVEALPQVAYVSKRLRVAMLNRSNAWSAPGGDTRIMLQMQEAVRTHGIEITYPETEADCTESDILHFVNMTLPEPLSHASALAEALGKPFVLTTLFEDWNQYLAPSHQTFTYAKQFVEGKVSLSDMTELVLKQTTNGCGPRLNVEAALGNASALLACGESEAARIRSSYPNVADRVHIVPFAVTSPQLVDDHVLESLLRTLGFDQYVLCIGRLETRKNQLMLLAALQNEDIPIVFATGGHTPQPAYRATVQQWKRNAPVRYLERVPWHSMSTVIRAASAHVLPSFYELPGLVHLECASAGIPIVASTWGALTDYLPESAFYPCDPTDIESIRNATLNALKRPAAPRPQEIANSYTIERLGDALASVYEALPKFRSPKKYQRLTYSTTGHQAVATGGIHVAV